MGAPLNNKNALGKETGRKSAYQEVVDANRLWEKWSNPQELVDLKEKIKKDEPVSLEDIFFAMAASKKESILLAIFKKLYPDNVNLFGQQDINININNDGQFYIHSAQRPAGSDEVAKQIQGNSLRPEVGEDNDGGKPINTGSASE